MDGTAVGLLVLAGVFGFFMAFNNGANDVANAFASAVGARAITIEHAVVIAGVMNLVGAVLLGGVVSAKLITGVISPDQFGSPGSFVAAMFCVLLASGAFVLASTLFGLPVSSSHAIVGSLVGVTVAVAGAGAIEWALIGAIAASWVVSPALAGLVSMGLLGIIRRLIIRGGEPGVVDRVRVYVPWLLAATGLVLLMVMLKGVALSGLKDRAEWWHYALVVLFVAPYLVIVGQIVMRWWTEDQPDEGSTAEDVFRRLQVGTSSYVAFAHGANDVANAISPVFAISLVLTRAGQLPRVDDVEGASVPLWILVLGGVGIAVGVGTLGGRVIETLARKVTRLTNSKGFCVDFAAASTVVTASLLGLPVSSTHAATGAIVGTGILERGEVDLRILARIALAWVVTVPAAALLTVALYGLARLLFGFEG